MQQIRKLLFKLFLTFLFLHVFQLPLLAQDGNESEGNSLEQTLQTLSEDAARSYLNPIASAYGSDLNAGWFHLAPDPEFIGFDLEVGFVAMGTFFSDANKSFSTSGAFRFTRDQATNMVADIPDAQIRQALVNEIISADQEVEISGATIIGSSTDSLKIKFLGGDVSFTNPYTGRIETMAIDSNITTLPVAGFSELANIEALPLMAPQISLGTLFGTQATFRYLPSTKLNNDLGEFNYFGFGLQHNPSVWLPFDLPINIAASFYTQKLTIGELFETKATAYGINASKELGWAGLNITPYAGFMYESSDMRVTYDLIYDKPDGTQGTIPIDFTMQGENKTRATLGLSVRFLLININADYNIGEYNSISAGITIRI